MLPLLAALSAARARGESVSAVFARLPRRSGCSGIVRELPREISNLIVSGMSPNDRTIMEAKFEGGAPTAMELDEIRANIRGYFTREDGFGDVSWINWLDGVRIGFSNGDVAHVRPSGNAPELRIYANADTMERARRIVSIFLRRIQAVRAFTSAPCALRLGGAVQNYDWGGFRFIPALLGRENAEQKPHAELWIGAHPRAPSIAELTAAGSGIVPIALDRLIEDAGSAVLGADAARAFGGRLPYLLKVLDARSMLSIQAHPSKDQAREGFARENSLGIPLSSPSRCYVDDNHKPEVHVALTDFWMLHGFRPLEEIAAVCAAAMPELPVGVNAGADPDARRTLLRELYGRIMTMPQPEVDRILGPLITRLSAGARTDKDSPDYWAMEASRLHSGIGGYDRGIFSFYLLNLIHLRPGQGTFQAAGTLHAYLEGVNVELMASSDNVLRGGLTTKHVDTGELLKILTFDSGKPRILDGETVSRTETRYPTTAEEFLLSRIEILPGAPHREMNGHGPDCLIVMEGEAVIHAGDADLALSRGGIALVPAGLPYTVDAGGVRAVLYKAGMPTGQKP
jgi:mannose-6-phosphate isomerase class I